MYHNRQEELREWPLQQFYAIDLFAYLDALPKEQVGKGTIWFSPTSAVKGRSGSAERLKPISRLSSWASMTSAIYSA